jgi:16S rRNA (cytidine1402-2'-O)-methyltransferase
MLYLVPTPLGNLEDITLRALRILKEVEYILAEDTRVSRKLLQHFEITTPLRAYHAHNEHGITAQIVQDLLTGMHIALISDAGTPGISDPGFLLVNACLEKKLPFTCLPGANAIIPALTMSGLPLHEFHFAGFLPQKKGRHTAWERISQYLNTTALFESPHRLLKCLEEITKYCGPERLVCVVREISKVFEEVKRGPASEVLAYYQEHPDKCVGEIVVILDGGKAEGPKG